jgi:5-methylcytosine-specific restriction endonuclease McrA
MNCIRCGREEKIELHHIKPKVEGGSDDTENKEPLCSACHDYEHAKQNIIKTLERERKRRQSKRVAVLEHRLDVLETLNTPELIRQRRTYQTWWIDESTHEYPRYEKVGRERREETKEQDSPQIAMEL